MNKSNLNLFFFLYINEERLDFVLCVYLGLSDPAMNTCVRFKFFCKLVY